VREHIFRPFFTTKPAGVGTGLGLGIAKRIVTQEFNGAISFTSEPGRTEFVVTLPVESSQTEAAPASQSD
jgi:signal transduction histidine kinase